jgi:excisionase family DNA binding protein
MGGGVPVAGIAEPQPSFSRDDLLTATEVAEVLRVKRTTALEYMRRGVVPACKIGRRWYAAKPLLDRHLDHLFDPNSHR